MIMHASWPEVPTVWHSDEFEPLVEMHLPRSPVAAGADGRKRAEFKAALRSLAAQVPWMYTGDVSVTIEWTVHLRWRYESDRAEDVDNIVKPIIDAISGPGGSVLDDTQINQVSVSWQTWTRTDRQHIRVSLRSLDHELYLDRRSLVLVEIRPRLCLPMPALSDEPEARQRFLDAIDAEFDAHDRLVELGMGWEDARGVLPIQRLLHRNKLREFSILTPIEYRSGRPAGQDVSR
jgi:Holliday junction resolvase RusA-like endonuclease